MQMISAEDVPEELAEYARKRVYQVVVSDLDKRVRALKTVFESPRSDMVYVRMLADKLWAKCVSAGRGDLANEVMYIKYDPSYEKKKASNKQAIAAAKKRFEECLDRN